MDFNSVVDAGNGKVVRSARVLVIDPAENGETPQFMEAIEISDPIPQIQNLIYGSDLDFIALMEEAEKNFGPIETYVKNLLYVNGFKTRSKLALIDDADIEACEDFMRTQASNLLEATTANFGIFANNIPKFIVVRGDRKLIHEMAKFFGAKSGEKSGKNLKKPVQVFPNEKTLASTDKLEKSVKSWLKTHGFDDSVVISTSAHDSSAICVCQICRKTVKIKSRNGKNNRGWIISNFTTHMLTHNGLGGAKAGKKTESKAVNAEYEEDTLCEEVMKPKKAQPKITNFFNK